jgi:hypothetical protein
MADNRYEPILLYPSVSTKAASDILTADWKLAKPLLLFARYGRFPINEKSTLFGRIYPALKALLGHAFGYLSDITTQPIDVICSRFDSWYDDFENPITRGAIVQMCELVRIPRKDEDHIRHEALEKEISVYRRVVLERPLIHWDAMWNGGSFVPESEMGQWATADIGFALRESLMKIRRTTIFPSMSRKLLPARAREWLKERPSHVFEDPDISTPAELEKFYIVHGVHFEGPSELKQRWYMHGIVPRTYATAGESAYTYSKYLKEVWNILWNSMPSTEKFGRVDVTRLRRSGAKFSFAMYDLTTFTSNFETHRDFVLSLSRFLDVEVNAFDGRKGYHSMSLKVLLEEYANNLCVGVKWYTEMGGLQDIDEDFHAVAGLLGIIGNIASCGFAHGVFLRSLVDSMEESGVAGDDAIFVYLIKTGWRPKTDTIGKYLGTLAHDKVYDFEEEDSVYLKRGVRETGDGNLQLSEYIMFPKTLFLAKNDTERFRESRDIHFERYLFERMFVSSLGSTFRSAGRIRTDYTLFRSFLLDLYNRLSLPITGHCPGIGRNHYVPSWAEDLFVPALDGLGNPEYVRDQHLDHFDGWGRFAETDLPFEAVEFDITPGCLFQSKMTKKLSYLCRLGILVKEKVMIEVSGHVAYSKMENMLEQRRIRPVYEFRVKDDVLMSFCHQDALTVSGCPLGTVSLPLFYDFAIT